MTELKYDPKLVEIFDRYNIDDDSRVNATMNILDKRIIILCDDSSSMNEDYHNDKTKWNHVKDIVKIIADMQFICGNRCDIRFLNKTSDPCFTSDQVDKLFAFRPSGQSGLISLDAIIKNIISELKKEKNDIMLLIVLDCVPNDKNFHKIIKNMTKKNKNISISLMLLSNDSNIKNKSYNIGQQAINFVISDTKDNNKKCIIL